MSDKVYRPVEMSDLPKIQLGKLKAFQSIRHFPAKLISARCMGRDQVIFLVSGEEADWITPMTNIVVDVTPERRYAIFNCRSGALFATVSLRREDAEATIQRFNKNNTTQNIVVEFNLPAEAE